MKKLLFGLGLFFASNAYSQVTVKATVKGYGNKIIIGYWKDFSFIADTLGLKKDAVSVSLNFSEPVYVRVQTIEPENSSPFFLAFPGDTLSFEKDNSHTAIKGGPESYNLFLIRLDSLRKVEFAGKRPDYNLLTEFALKQSDSFFEKFKYPHKQLIKANHELSAITNYTLYNFMVKYSDNPNKINSLAQLIKSSGTIAPTADDELKFVSRVNFNSADIDAANVSDVMMMNNLVRILRFQAVKKDSTLQDTDPYLIEHKIIKDLFKESRYRTRLMAYNLYSRIDGYLQYPMQLAETDRFIAEFKNENFITGLTGPIEALYFRQLSTIGSLAKGAVAPKFKLPDVSGKMVSLSDFKGKVVYLDLWASWCGPCLSEMPYMKALQQKFKDKNIELISISIDTKKDRWLAKIAALKLGGAQLIDNLGAENSKIAKDYKIHGVPHYVLIDKSGRIAVPYAPRPSSAAEVEKEISKLLE